MHAEDEKNAVEALDSVEAPSPGPRKYWIVIALAGLFICGKVYVDRDFWLTTWKQTKASMSGAKRGSDSRHQDMPFSPREAFDLSAATIPTDKVFAGGPPKDGIPALTDPEFIAAREAAYLRPQDRVIGVVHEGYAKAYPLKILTYHEIVNDHIGGLPVAVTYCPLCDSCAAFDRRTELGEREFGVSGLLYNSNVLMFDRRSEGVESLWSQVMTRGVTGPGADKSLTSVPMELTTWQDWLARYPETLVLSLETGHKRNYDRSPYEQYFSREDLMFPVDKTDDRLQAKSRVLGVWSGSKAKAYPESFFSSERTQIEDEIDGKRVVVSYDPENKSLRVIEADSGVQWMYSFWFAWHAFYPETEVAGL